MSQPALTSNNLDAFWMPFTANRQFKKNPRLFVGTNDAELRRGVRPGEAHAREVAARGPHHL